MNADINAAIVRWQLTEKNRQKAVAEEIEARAVLCQLAFPKPSVGTNNAPMSNGDVLKGRFPQRYSFDKDAEKVNRVLKMLPAGVRNNLVKWKPELSVTAFKALEPAHKKLVEDIVTITNDRPQLSIETPKVS